MEKTLVKWFEVTTENGCHTYSQTASDIKIASWFLQSLTTEVAEDEKDTIWEALAILQRYDVKTTPKYSLVENFSTRVKGGKLTINQICSDLTIAKEVIYDMADNTAGEEQETLYKVIKLLGKYDG